MRKMGAEDLAFASIVASGANGASPHSIPGDRRLEDGDLVVMDFGARARGYCSDMTRTVAVRRLKPRVPDKFKPLIGILNAIDNYFAPLPHMTSSARKTKLFHHHC